VSYQLTNGFFRKDTYVEGFETFMFDRFYLDNNVAAATTSESVVTHFPVARLIMQGTKKPILQWTMMTEY